MKKILLNLWQFPQYLLGKILCIIWKNSITKETTSQRLFDDTRANSTIYFINYNYGVSFGPIIFLRVDCDKISQLHEYGHAIQSKYLGPLYLLLVGLPSIIQNIISRIIKGEYSKNYYFRYPENWADKLVGIKRQ